jgi:hypothetical protein
MNGLLPLFKKADQNEKNIMRKRNKVGHVILRLRERKAFDRFVMFFFYFRNRVIEGRWVAAITINEAQ